MRQTSICILCLKVNAQHPNMSLDYKCGKSNYATWDFRILLSLFSPCRYGIHVLLQSLFDEYILAYGKLVLCCISVSKRM